MIRLKIASDPVHAAANRPIAEWRTVPRRRSLKLAVTVILSAGLFGMARVGYPDSRSQDGWGNNLKNPAWGSAGSRFLRHSPASYGDGVSSPADVKRPDARAISNIVNAQSGPLPNTRGATDFVWQWGQFIDHDLDLTGTGAEPFNILVPTGDPFFDPAETGIETIALNRSVYDPDSDPREQINQITGFIDASNVYGSDPDRAAALRTGDGTGRLKTSAGNLLPFNTLGLPNAGGSDDASLFLAGDVRANEQVGLTALHTLFVREHNFLAGLVRKLNPALSDEEIYQKARALVGAELQVITYKEFLPVLLGKNALAPYKGYDRRVNPGIDSVFATAAFRVGHTMLSPVIQRLDSKLEPAGSLPLRNAFFAPEIVQEGGIEPILRGLARQLMQDTDPYVVDDVRNFLFGLPGQGGFDLAALNIQRGRDHGLADYNTVRKDFGLLPAMSFADITSDVELQTRLRAAYGSVDNIDVWVGGLAEDKYRDALVGELFFTILKDQFQRLRDGDRYWYQKVFKGIELMALERTTLAKVIRRNTSIRRELQDNVFKIGMPARFQTFQRPLSPLQILRQMRAILSR